MVIVYAYDLNGARKMSAENGDYKGDFIEGSVTYEHVNAGAFEDENWRGVSVGLTTTAVGIEGGIINYDVHTDDINASGETAEQAKEAPAEQVKEKEEQD